MSAAKRRSARKIAHMVRMVRQYESATVRNENLLYAAKAVGGAMARKCRGTLMMLTYDAVVAARLANRRSMP